MNTARILALAAGLLAGPALSRTDGTAFAGHRKGMKVTSAILTTMSGKLGGAVAATARGGVKYFRALVFPGNPRSQSQTLVRSILSRFAARWRSTLNDASRAAWALIAPDDSSGIDAYIRANATLALTAEGQGFGPVDTAPASLALGTDYALPEPVIDNSANTIAFVLGEPAERLCGYAVFLSSPQSSSRLARQFPYRYLGEIASDAAAGAATIAIPAAYQGATGQAQYAKVVALGYTTSGGNANGQTGTPQEFRCLIQA